MKEYDEKRMQNNELPMNGGDAMTTVRPAAVADMFYPGDAVGLAEYVQNEVGKSRFLQVSPKAIIVPHAGYVYSGPVAANGYAQLAAVRERVRRVVLLGPAHYVGFEGLAVSGMDEFLTPLGSIPLDTQAIATLRELPQVTVLDEAHTREHSLEVHLPFLQETLDRFGLIPLAVGQTSFEEVAEVLEHLWGDDETLIVISSDLSHYHTCDKARELDRATTRAIEHLDSDQLRGDFACGYLPIGGLLTLARRRGLRCATVDMRNSGETAGGKDRVVGYGAYLLADEFPQRLSDYYRRELLQLAKYSIREALMGTEVDRSIEIDKSSPQLQQRQSSFVTLKIDGQLRGCMGSLEATRPLIIDVARNARMSAMCDPRFPPVTWDNVERLQISISVLTPPLPLEFSSEEDLLAKIRPGVDGLVLVDQGRRGTFLPAVWESLPERRQFWEQLKQKAGLPIDHWSETLRVLRYETESFGEQP